MTKETSMKKTLFSVASVLLFSAALIFTVRWIQSYRFGVNCGDYLGRAANANTVELASDNLTKAIEYLQRTEKTSGNTGVFLTMPSNDVGYWFSNLKASSEELDRAKTAQDQTLRSNVLMKLRETLTDNGKDGTELVCPSDISVFPNQTAWMLACCIAWVMVLVGLLILYAISQ